jgi:hypothetical protein
MAANKRLQVEKFILVYEERYGHLPTRDEVAIQLGVSSGTIDTVLVPIKENRQRHPIQFSKAQRSHVETAINIQRKALERDFEARVQYQVKLYIQKHMPNLERQREELSKKIATYDALTNKHKSIFTADEFKTILMCLHPDGQRTKDKLQSAFINFKSKEGQLVKK